MGALRDTAFFSVYFQPFVMDSIPRITVRTHHDETNNKYKLVLTKLSPEEFKLEIGNAIHVYRYIELC